MDGGADGFFQGSDCALGFWDVVVSRADGEVYAGEGVLDAVIFAVCMDLHWLKSALDIEL
jgi:hypothetical protein